jgi:hypothetical protein
MRSAALCCYRCRRKRRCKVCGDPAPGLTRRCAACRALRQRLAWLAQGAKRPPPEERAGLVALYQARAALGLELFGEGG